MKAKHEERMLAIWDSITHWLENYEIAMKPNSAPDDLQTSSKHCALCHYDSNFSNPTTEKTKPPDQPIRITCMHCPIHDYCGTTVCKKTPYWDVHEAIEDYFDEPNYDWSDDDQRRLAGLVALEYSFLIDVAFAEYEEIGA